uniref:Uncharacterized protein n=1 Tax=Anguilla anguilla TaxID=7936 RepID=A0A0E9X9H8_ANGAN
MRQTNARVLCRVQWWILLAQTEC